jgi:murein DD-endopeptidase MepM/ murein hydrolase activator NlpD
MGKKRRNVILSVKEVKFPVLELTLAADRVILSPEDLDRTKREDIRLGEIFQEVSVKLWDGGFVRPLDNELSTVYGTKRIMNGEWVSIHKGVDIKGKEGEEVKASNNGRVVLAEGLFFGGNTVIVDHGQGIYTIYMHLSKMKVNPGDIVSKGEAVGLVGSSGRATGPHLHFGAKVMNTSVNPVSLTELKL